MGASMMRAKKRNKKIKRWIKNTWERFVDLRISNMQKRSRLWMSRK